MLPDNWSLGFRGIYGAGPVPPVGNSAVAKVVLREGALIFAVNRRKCNGPDEVRAGLRRAVLEGGGAAFKVRRGDRVVVIRAGLGG
jgi:hypothetical protein